MAERFKAAVLKTVERKLRGFESLSLRQYTFSTEFGANVCSVTLHVIFVQEAGEVAERLKAAAC